VLILDRENSQQTWSMRRYVIGDLAAELPIRLLGRFTTPRAPDLNDPALLAACTEIKPFIIVDSFQDFHIGLKEDKADDMTIVGHWLDGLIDAGAVGVLVLHHVPKSSSGSRAGKYRGSTAIVGGAGAAMTIEKTGSLTAMVSGFKTRDGEDMSLNLKFTFPTQAEIDAKTGKVTCVATGAKNVSPQDRLSERILDCVKKHPGITKTAIVQMIGGNRNAIFATTGALIADKKLAVDGGKITPAASALEVAAAESENLGS
jgi:AAA domain